MSLVEFLLARIAEDEENARACQNWSECGPDNWEVDLEPGYGCPAHPSVARQIAECEAKRQVVDLSQGWAVGSQSFHEGVQATLRATLQLLALPYANHPDWLEEWRP